MKKYIKSDEDAIYGDKNPTVKHVDVGGVYTRYVTWYPFNNARKYRKYDNEPKDPADYQCSIAEIHPYDLQEYYWAKKDSPASAKIVRGSKVEYTVPLPAWDEYEYDYAYYDSIDDILVNEIRKANSRLEPHMDRT